MSTSRHTITVEKLRDIPDHSRVHPAVTAVVERSGSYYKVCAISQDIPQYGNRYSGMVVSDFVVKQAGSVRAAMITIAEGVARTYGATYVEAR